MAENEQTQTSQKADNDGVKVTPLSLPLDKDTTTLPNISSINDVDDATPQQAESRPKRVSQKEFIEKVLKRVEERISQRRGRRSWLPGFWIVFLTLFLAPFFFRAGNDIYDTLRSKLSFYMGSYGLFYKPDSAKNSTVNTVTDGTIAENLNELIKQQQKIMKNYPRKVIVIHPERMGVFSLKREKKRLYELSGLDIDDPVKGSDIIEKINSVEILVLMMESFDRIIDNAKGESVSKFHIKNAVEGKRKAIKRIRKLR
ncbi:MAG: hypothetical protein IEMM0002_0012 [bacterium]|nr:MAG: hypothetical protein IEMM0002_0012 [bacterium]